MTYNKTNWIDNETDLSAANMNKIEQGIVDAENNNTITTINNKTGAIEKADIVALGIPAQDTNTTYSEITTAEIDAGTATTLRTITARRLKYAIDKVPGITYTAGTNVQITGNTISATDTIYTHPTSAGNKHIPSGGIEGQILRNSASGTVTWDTLELPEGVDLSTKQDKLIASTNITIAADGKTISATDNNTTYSEITTAEIDAGTAQTLRTITARRLKYATDKIQTIISALTKTDVGLGNVTNDKQMPISGGILENYREKLTTTTGAINLSLGNVFYRNATANTTFSITNAVSGQSHSFTLYIEMGATVRTLTFPTSIKWVGGEIPDMTTVNKMYVLVFSSIDGGTTWYGNGSDY
ncbi:MAG TPA: hypothetical protein VFC79_11800 [Tissierellaceae bacterium]|nr:hypothetical protein [Tissierellaceae bacterium]